MQYLLHKEFADAFTCFVCFHLIGFPYVLGFPLVLMTPSAMASPDSAAGRPSPGWGPPALRVLAPEALALSALPSAGSLPTSAWKGQHRYLFTKCQLRLLAKPSLRSPTRQALKFGLRSILQSSSLKGLQDPKFPLALLPRRWPSFFLPLSQEWNLGGELEKDAGLWARVAFAPPDAVGAQAHSLPRARRA